MLQHARAEEVEEDCVRSRALVVGRTEQEAQQTLVLNVHQGAVEHLVVLVDEAEQGGRAPRGEALERVEEEDRGVGVERRWQIEERKELHQQLATLLGRLGTLGAKEALGHLRVVLEDGGGERCVLQRHGA